VITLAPELRVYLACGVTDMGKGMVGLAMLVRQTLVGIQSRRHGRTEDVNG
jgi:hypothetical protein